MSITLPELPFAKDALSPYISEETLNFHYGKHHNAYVVKTNDLIKGTDLEGASLEQIIVEASKDVAKAGLFNNAAQVYNHTFFWNSIKPNGGGLPTGDIAEKIQEDFGSYEAFAEAFKNAGATQFGSGWAWLVLKNGKFEVVKTGNASTPIVEESVKPILTVDVWEHAYYLDYQNRRPDYLGVFLDHLVNWDFANQNLKG